MKRLLSTVCVLLLLGPVADLAGQDAKKAKKADYTAALKNYERLAQVENAQKSAELRDMKAVLQSEYEQVLQLKQTLGTGHPSVKERLARIQAIEAQMIDMTGVIDLAMSKGDRIAATQRRLQRLADVMQQLNDQLAGLRAESELLEKQLPGEKTAIRDFYHSADVMRERSKHYFKALENVIELRKADSMRDLAAAELVQRQRVDIDLQRLEQAEQAVRAKDADRLQMLQDMAIVQLQKADKAHQEHADTVAVDANQVVLSALGHLAKQQEANSNLQQRYQRSANEYKEVLQRLDRIETILEKLLKEKKQ